MTSFSEVLSPISQKLMLGDEPMLHVYITKKSIILPLQYNVKISCKLNFYTFLRNKEELNDQKATLYTTHIYNNSKNFQSNSSIWNGDGQTNIIQD